MLLPSSSSGLLTELLEVPLPALVEKGLVEAKYPLF